MSGAKSLVKGVLGIPASIIRGPRKPGRPPAQEDPQVALAREATSSAIAGDIATRNVQQRSSTLGAGARFLQTSTLLGNQSARTALNTGAGAAIPGPAIPAAPATPAAPTAAPGLLPDQVPAAPNLIPPKKKKKTVL